MHWSTDPEKCFGCGGCKSVMDKKAREKKCIVCSKYWRKDDVDLVVCKVRRKIHCDYYCASCVNFCCRSVQKLPLIACSVLFLDFIRNFIGADLQSLCTR